MAKQITLISYHGDEIKTIDLGWSWSIFLFSPIFSIPLFARHLYASGILLLFLWLMDLLLILLATGTFSDQPIIVNACIGLTSIGFACQFFLALKGNEMSIQHYLDIGWEISEQEERVSTSIAPVCNKIINEQEE